MSGYFAAAHMGGASFDRTVADAMLGAIRPLAVDGESLALPDGAALGHAAFHAVQGAETGLPLRDGPHWLTGHIRLDARRDLVAALHAAGRAAASLSSGDAQLALMAYAAWGGRFASRLQGDFAIAIWDAAARRMVAARDPLGNRSLYFAASRDLVVCTNVLGAALALPGVSTALAPEWLLEFARDGIGADWGSTVYRDVQAVPAAHTLVADASGITLRRHWELPLPEPIRFGSDSEYVDAFRDLLRECVRDRLRCDGLAIRLSGGLDSTSLAVLAREAAPAMPIAAVTFCYDTLIPDREWEFAEPVGRQVGATHSRVLDDAPIELTFALDGAARAVRPVDPAHAAWWSVAPRLAAHARVCFYGEDGDALLHPPSLLASMRALPPGEMADYWRAWFAFRRQTGTRPWLGVRWRRRLAQFMNPHETGPFAWLRSDAQRRYARTPRDWFEGQHPARPLWSYAFRAPTWIDLFEANDPQYTGANLDVALPLQDPRLFAFVAAIPPVPWLQRKQILREAMRGLLPPPVLARPKTTVAGFYAARARQLRSIGLPRVTWCDAAREFIDVPALEREMVSGSDISVCSMPRAVALNGWLSANA